MRNIQNLNKKMATSEIKKNAIVGKILLVQKLMGKDIVRRLQESDNQIYIAQENRLVGKIN